MTDPPAPETPAEPEAPDSDQRVRPVIVERRTRSAGRGFIWLIPVAALVVSVWIALDAWSDRGPRIVVEFAEVHGLEAGDVVRCRGVEIGRVDAIEWSALGAGTEATRSIRVVATIRADASDLIRSGARFWIARPEFDYGGIRGLETVVGPRYLALSPGTGDVERGPFVGLRAAPLEWVDRVDDLEIVIESAERRGMRRGGMVTYRGLPAGRILEVELASDASRVEARVVIDRRHATLIRDATRFYSTSGVSFEFGLDGLRADVESLESLISGGIAFATPPDAGDRAVTGGRFVLAPRAEDAWLEWRPRIALGGHVLEAPSSVRATLRWTNGIFRASRSRSGWITRVDDEFVAIPAALLTPPEDAKDVVFECGEGSMSPNSFDDHEAGRTDSIRLVSVASMPETIVKELVGGPSIETTSLPRVTVPLLIWTGSQDGPVPVTRDAWSIEAEGLLLDSGLLLAQDVIGSPVTEAESGRPVCVVVATARGMMVVAVPVRSATTE